MNKVSLVRIEAKPKKAGRANTRGWQARISYPGMGKKYHSKLFSDSRYGGEDEARKAAEAYLLRVAGTLPHRDVLLGNIRRGKPLRHNTTGRNGVFQGIDRRRGGEFPYFAFFYIYDKYGRRQNGARRFYYGESRTKQRAFELAVKGREEYEKAYAEGGVAAVVSFWNWWDNVFMPEIRAEQTAPR